MLSAFEVWWDWHPVISESRKAWAPPCLEEAGEGAETGLGVRCRGLCSCRGTRQTHTSSHAAAAAKLLQLWPTLCDPRDGSPPGSPVPRILQARTLEWVAISFSNEWKWKVKVKSLSHVRPLATPWTAAYQASPSMGFSRQEYWSGVPLPSLTSSHRGCISQRRCVISMHFQYVKMTKVYAKVVGLRT